MSNKSLSVSLNYVHLSISYRRVRTRGLSSWNMRQYSNKACHKMESGVISSKLKNSFTIKPSFDWKFLCDPSNLEYIRNNIKRRKEVGNIDALITEASQLNLISNKSLVNDEIFEKYPSLISLAYSLPNTTHPDVPIGDESKAVLLEKCGQMPGFDFRPQTMLQLARALNLLRLEQVGNTTGAKSYYLKGELAELEECLIQFALERLINQGFELISVPDLIHPNIIEGCGFKTSGVKTQVYRLEPSRHKDLCLAGTGEMPLAGFFANRILSSDELPKRVCTVSRCFRAEKTNASDEDGIYRVHQFTKVEMFGVTKSDDAATESGKLMNSFRDIQKSIFSDLGLHFRILDMPTQELGAPAYRKYDMEAWMAGAKKWGEISSTSNCTDYQSRRLNIRYKDNSDGVIRFCHTVNGTACAVPRLLIGLFETHQTMERHVRLPPCLGSKVLRGSLPSPSLKWIRKLRSD